MSFEIALKFRECERKFDLLPIYSCEFCFGPLEVDYDYDEIRKNISKEKIANGPDSLWRYAPLLPCDENYKVDIGTGYTPLIQSKNLAKQLGLKKLWK